jgi:hypothetical protein
MFIKRGLFERMNNEVNDDDDTQSTKKDYSKTKLKKIQNNHISVDDMPLDDEYLQHFNREDIKIKQNIDRKNEQDEEKEIYGLGKDINESEDNENDADNYEDSEEVDDEPSSSEINGNQENALTGSWTRKFEILCSKLDNKSINISKFEKQFKVIVDSLDPSKDENNKKRICLLTSHLIEYYQSLFTLKISKNNDDTNLFDYKLAKTITKHIFYFTNKYGNKSTKKEPSIFVELFKDILRKINNEYLKIKTNERKFPSLNIVTIYKSLII